MRACNKCGCYLDETEDIYDKISYCLVSGEPVFVVVECPNCGAKVISGGEPDYCMYDNREGINMFGQSYEEDKHGKLPVFKARFMTRGGEETDEPVKSQSFGDLLRSMLEQRHTEE